MLARPYMHRQGRHQQVRQGTEELGSYRQAEDEGAIAVSQFGLPRYVPLRESWVKLHVQATLITDRRSHVESAGRDSWAESDAVFAGREVSPHEALTVRGLLEKPKTKTV
jgi:hypothetical protein